ncbi:MAG: hypothetical protein ABII82_09760 [Verrucomicrobiota bacterium]
MNVHARISKEWRRRMFFMALMINGSALWFLYDGYIAWPAEEVRHQQLRTVLDTPATDENGEANKLDIEKVSKDPEAVRAWEKYAKANDLPEKLPKHRSAGDLSGQRGIGGVLLLGGLAFVGWVALQHRKSVRADGDLITGANGEQVDINTIVEMDRRKWANKGIAYAIYQVDGRRKRLCLDDHKFLGCEAIILEAEKRIAERTAPPVAEPAEEPSAAADAS